MNKNNIIVGCEPGVTKAVKKYCNDHSINYNIDIPKKIEKGAKKLKFWWVKS